MNLAAQKTDTKTGDKPSKAFSVYSDRARSRASQIAPPRSSPLKRGAEPLASIRPTKIAARPTPTSFLRRAPLEPTLSKATIEQLVEQKVSAILAAQSNQQKPPQPASYSASSPPPKEASNATAPAPAPAISEEVQRRLASIEQRLEGQEGARAEGLSFLLMAKQHQARGEMNSALKMYQLARPYFPGNEKLARKIEVLRGKIEGRRRGEEGRTERGGRRADGGAEEDNESGCGEGDESYQDDDRNDAESRGAEDSNADSTDEEAFRPLKTKKPRAPHRQKRFRLSSPDPLAADIAPPTPRTTHLLSVINTRDLTQIKRLKGVGPKRAEGIVECLAELGEGWDGGDGGVVTSLEQLSGLRGVGRKTVEGMRAGIEV